MRAIVQEANRLVAKLGDGSRPIEPSPPRGRHNRSTPLPAPVRRWSACDSVL